MADWTDPKRRTSVAENIARATTPGPVGPDPMTDAPAGSADDLAAEQATVEHHRAATADRRPPMSSPAHGGPGVGRRCGEPRGRAGDRVFAFLTGGASALVILVVVLIALFLLLKAIPSIADDKVNFLTSTQWSIGHDGTLRFGVAGLAYTTVLSSSWRC